MTAVARPLFTDSSTMYGNNLSNLERFILFEWECQIVDPPITFQVIQYNSKSSKTLIEKSRQPSNPCFLEMQGSQPKIPKTT
jgi:hypothetical protein